MPPKPECSDHKEANTEIEEQTTPIFWGAQADTTTPLRAKAQRSPKQTCRRPTKTGVSKIVGDFSETTTHCSLGVA